MVLKAQMEPQALKGQQDHKVLKVQQEIQEHKALMGHKEPMEL